jgi:putative hydrolase of the HAD superfamily
MIAAVAFDLDDTLFLERDYVRSGFRAVDRCLKDRLDDTRDWFAALWLDFEAGVRGDAFNRVLAAAGRQADPLLVADLVRCYREHRPDLRPCPDVEPALETLRLPPERLGIISDGPPDMQRRKFEALGLQKWFGHLIFTDLWGLEFRKPHPRAFEQFEKLTGCPPRACAYVSDNPAKDFRAPHRRGWTTVRIVRPGGLHAAEPAVPGEVDAVIADLGSLTQVLALGNGNQ